MRKSLLAVAALMGAAILPAEAAVLRVDENTFANTGLKLQIRAQNLGKTTNDGKNYTDFSIANARVYFSGQVNKIVQFGANLDFAVHSLGAGRGFHQGTGNSRANDAFINFKFMDEFQVMAGLYRVPFSRATLTDSYSYYIPTGYGWGLSNSFASGNRPNAFAPFTIGSNIGNTFRDAGLTFWGNIMDGLIKYQIGVFDGRYDHTNAPIGNEDKLAFSGRIQFTPTMLGYKAEKGFTLADTYLGRQNVLTIGLGYNAQKWGTTGLTFNTSGTAKAWTVDAMWEQKFGDIVPNIQLGYVNNKDVADYSAPNVNIRKNKAYYLQAQLLYDQVIGIGKPALGIRYEKHDEASTRQVFNTNTGALTTSTTGNDRDTQRWGVFVNYYIKGQDAKVQFGVDSVKATGNRPSQTNSNYKDSFTDWTLALQVKF